MPKAIVDTSVFIAGFLSQNKFSRPSQIISLWQQNAFTLIMSPQILQELVAKLYDKQIPEEQIIAFVKIIAKIGLHIPGAWEVFTLSSVDASDNIFLAADYESHADYLVSFDKQSLLPMKHFHGTIICTPDHFVRAILMPPAP